MVRIAGIGVEKGAQSGVKLSASGRVVYIDSWRVSGGEKADIILITHEHFDHCDPASVGSLRKEDTLVIGPPSCSQKLEGLRAVRPGDSLDVKGVKIEAVHAYNSNHPRGECLGFLVTLAGKRIYHAGDTGRIPEMKNLGQVDIAFLPVGGTYTMDAGEAALAANQDIRPGTAVPIHYGDVVGSGKDAGEFKKLCECEVIIL